MLTLSKQRELSRFLAGLPADKALELAALAERRRISGERNFPAELILDALRPTLSAEEALRTPTPQRLFCEPFADFLVDDREIKQPGRIARSSIRHLWHWLIKDAMGPALHEQEAHISDAVLAENLRHQDEHLERLRRNILNCLRITLSGIGQNRNARAELAERVGGEETLADFEEIAFLLSTADDLLPLRETLPKRIDTLTDEHIAQVLSARDRVAEREPELVPYLGLLVLARLHQPWQALRLTGNGRRGRPDFNAVGDLLLADAENLAVDIASTQVDILNPDALAVKLYRFERLSRGLSQEIRNRYGAQWAQTLQRVKGLALDTVDGLLAKAPREVAIALPLTKPGPFNFRRQRTADFSRDPDPMKLDRALRWTNLLTNTAPILRNSTLAASHKKAIAAVSEYLTSYAESAAAELKTPGIEKHSRVQAYLEQANELLNTIIAAAEEDDARQRQRAAV